MFRWQLSNCWENSRKRNRSRATQREKDREERKRGRWDYFLYLNKKPGVRRNWIVSHSHVIMSLSQNNLFDVNSVIWWTVGGIHSIKENLNHTLAHYSVFLQCLCLCACLIATECVHQFFIQLLCCDNYQPAGVHSMMCLNYQSNVPGVCGSILQRTSGK